MKDKKDNKIIEKVIEMITNAKSSNTFNLDWFVRNPYKGFNTGKEVIRKLPLGTEKDFKELLKEIEDDISLSNVLKEEVLTILWAYRGMQEDSNLKRYERLEQQKIGLFRTPFPYTDKSGEDDIVEDEKEMIDIFSYLNNDYSKVDNAQEQVEEILSKLSEDERYLLVERFINNRSNVSIAKNLNLNESSVRRRIESILNKIRNSI